MTRLLSLAALAAVVASAGPAAAQSRDLATYALLAGSELRASGVSVVSGDVGVNNGALLASRPLEAPMSKLVASSMRLNGTSRCSQLFANDLLYPTGSACGPSHSFTS